MTCSEIRLSPDNKHLYTGNRDINYKKRDSLSHLTITDDPAGAPELKQVLSLPISIPRNFNITPKGKWIITGGQISNNLLAIRRNTETGALELTDHLIEVPSPQCILIKTD
ncbi:6-phosphogluconolactonase [Rubritalea halochordaticola]|uniref:6-phosphogluconolactonase n=2 Tax=Rubritalea halochordaticola TaxID=714537 RepID=A0ABP9V4Q7_9BACT